MPKGDIDQIAINTIRTLAIDAVQKANSGITLARRWGWPPSPTRCGSTR